MRKTSETISTPMAPKALGPYSQAVKAGGFLFISGQVPIDPDTGLMATGGIKEQTERSLQNIGAILEAAGLTFGDVVKTTVFLTKMTSFADMNEVYARFMGGSGPYPARATVEVSALPKAALVEIEAIAKLG